MHCLIVGAPGVGKSTLLQRITEAVGKPVYGFRTRKEKELWDPVLGNPIYIYPAGEIPVRSKENLVGYCKDRRPVVYKEAFDRFAPYLLAPIPVGSVVFMDEIGFMEATSELFCRGILRLLDGDVPVFAAVKDKNTPFLEQVRSHPKVKCFYLTEENRQEIYKQLGAELKVIL